MSHGWRYMGLQPFEILRMTYREFVLVSRSNVERTHDENERLAMLAIMSAAASRGKGKQGKIPKLEELYKRPTDEEVAKKTDTVEDLREKQKHTSEWLSQFDLSKFGKEGE